MPEDQESTSLNLAWWNERATFHLQTPLYQKHLARLTDGALSLLPIDVAALGDITGLRVLHLQCHVGTDTLSLSRMGADVIGVDFSDVAIEEARRLSDALGIPARFQTCEIADVGHNFPAAVDLVFSSHGVLSWLPDLDVWAHQIAATLVPGGRFYLSESHPMVWAFAEENVLEGDVLRLGLPYLSQPAAAEFEDPGSYADPQRATVANKTREWSWGLGDIINALISQGLELQWIEEHPEGFYPVIPELEEGDDGHYRLPTPLHGQFPLTFNLLARKPMPKPDPVDSTGRPMP